MGWLKRNMGLSVISFFYYSACWLIGFHADSSRNFHSQQKHLIYLLSASFLQMHFNQQTSKFSPAASSVTTSWVWLFVFWVFSWRNENTSEDQQVKCKIELISASITNLKFQLPFTKLPSIFCIFRSLFLKLVPFCYHYYTKKKKKIELAEG